MLSNESTIVITPNGVDWTATIILYESLGYTIILLKILTCQKVHSPFDIVLRLYFNKN